MKKCRNEGCRNQCMGEYCSPNCAAEDMTKRGTYGLRDLRDKAILKKKGLL